MPRPKSLEPKYCLHRASGRAFVTLSGERKYLGQHGTQESREMYLRLLNEWIAAGRLAAQPTTSPADEGVSVATLAAEFLEHARRYYVGQDGHPTSEVGVFEMILRPLCQLYSALAAARMKPMQLKAVREEMIRLGWCRKSINKHVHRVKSVFKWGGENLGVPGSVYQDLRTVSPLKIGRTPARESEPVRPVPAADIEPVRKIASRQVRAMIDLQLLTGMRSGEVCIMRTCDVDRQGKVWLYRPAHHKTAHHGHAREIRIGPKAQAVLEPFFKTNLRAFLFSPAEAEAERLAAAHQKRLERGTPIDRGNVPGSNRVASRRRRPADRFTVASYRQAIVRACQAAFEMPADLLEPRSKKDRQAEAAMDPAEQKRRRQERRAGRRAWRAAHVWHPHQLRHNAATLLRRQYGIEAARLVLGHTSSAVTEIYAEMDAARAEEIMAEVG